MPVCGVGFRLGTTPLTNSWRMIIIWLDFALKRTPNIDCYWRGGSTQGLGRDACLGFKRFMGFRDDLV